MTIQTVHRLIRERSNKINSNHYVGLLPSQIDAKVDEAIIFFMEHFAYVNKNSLEQGMQRLDMLSKLIKTEPILVSKLDTNKYKLDLNLTKNLYAHTIRVSWKDSCDKDVVMSFKRHDDLSISLTDSFQKPNKVWGRCIGVMEDFSIIIYTYEDVASVNLTYIKQPNKVFFGGYDSVDYLHCKRTNGDNCGIYYNQQTDPVQIELHSQYHDLIIDISVYLITGKTENFSLNKIINSKINQVT